MSQLFISHAEEDQVTAVQIGDALEVAGFSVWYYERDSVPGLDYLRQVSDAIEQCQALIVVISPSSVGSNQVVVEVIRAFETKKFFMPLRLGISHLEFQSQNPTMRMALGATASIAIPETGIAGIIDRIATGFKRLGVQPTPKTSRDENLSQQDIDLRGVSPDKIELTLFAPQLIIPGESSLVQIWLHRASDAEEVESRSKAFDSASQRRAALELDPETFQPGKPLQFVLRAGKLPVESKFNQLIWQGRPVRAIFEIAAPPEAPPTMGIGEAMLLQDNVPLESLKFKLETGGGKSLADPSSAVRRYRKAYLCYSSHDDLEVLRRVQLLKAANIEFEMNDVLSLRAGDKWEETTYRKIDEADVFFLFWSKAASESAWVARELHYALREERPGFIMPVILEHPIPPVPKELAHLHFQDSFAYLLFPKQPLAI